MDQSVECRQTVIVNVSDGLHMRPLALIANCARRFECEVRLRKDQLAVDAKSIFDLLTLNAPCGTSLVLEANGVGAREVVTELVGLFEANFVVSGEEGLSP